jgi:hypothetical protein
MKINVKGTEITLLTVSNENYISLTDMLKAKEGGLFIIKIFLLKLEYQHFQIDLVIKLILGLVYLNHF